MNFILESWGGCEIKDVDMVFVEDVQEVYIGGQPYGKDPIWIEPPKPEIGDYITKSGGFIKFTNYQDTDRNNLGGIYIGDHPETGEKLFIPANVGFEYNSNQGNLLYYNNMPNYDNVINDDIYDLLVKDNIVSTTESEAIKRYDGKYCTFKTIELISNYAKKDRFEVINWIKQFQPGFNDGEWYLPSLGELLLLYDNNKNNANKIINSINKIFPLTNSFTIFYCSSILQDHGSVWGANLKNRYINSSSIYTTKGTLPFLAIK